MRTEKTRHHMLWKRADYHTPLEKRTRGLFVVEARDINHRLLHLLLEPPEKPAPDVLREMRAMRTARTIIESLDHPIAGHFEEQLYILSLSRQDTHHMLKTRTPKSFDGNHRRANAAHVIVAMLAEHNGWPADMHEPIYHPSPIIVPDTREGMDRDGNWHCIVERPDGAQLPQTSGGRWTDMGTY